MKTVTGSGTVFADMEGDGFSFASVVRLEDDYILIAVAEGGKQRRVTLTSEQASAFAQAIVEAVGGHNDD